MPLSTLKRGRSSKARNIARPFSQNERLQDIPTEFWQLLNMCAGLKNGLVVATLAAV